MSWDPRRSVPSGANQQWFNQHLEDGKQKVIQAVALDEAKRPREAAFMYAEACNSLQMASQFEEDPARRGALQSKIQEYMQRAEVLAKAEPGPATPTAPTKDEADQLREKANFALEQAISKDEQKQLAQALPLYTEAVELFMAGCSATRDVEKQASMKRMACQVLERAEAIKKEQAAAQAPAPTATIDPAWAELFPEVPKAKIVAPKTSTNVRPAGGAGGGAGAGAGATQPRSGGGGGGGHHKRRSGGRPVSGTQRLLPAEIAVLRRSSYVNGRMFVPFMQADVTHERFGFKKPFTDKEGKLKLSPKQQSRLAGWKRPSEFMRDPKMINLVSAYSITQELVSDCSFVASLCITAAYERRFKKQLITNIIYPQNRWGQPVYNPSGKYMVKLFLNGVHRKVIVDDLLPVDKYGHPICSFSNTKNELWVSIIEKAYMKVNGGYDFPGSNSGIDLFCLTGWLPEHMQFNSKDFDKERTWQRLLSGAKYGDCLITIATGEMSVADEERFGLVQTHAYAVLDVREAYGVRLLQVKNPWAHKRWKGKYSAGDTARWTPQLKSALNYDPVSAMQFDNGIFWIDYDSMLRYYRGIYFNWNPGLFMYQQTVHAYWPKKAPGPINDSYNIGYNPQYSLTVTVPAAINKRKNATAALWLVLSRHVTRNEVTSSERDREGRIGAGAGSKAADPNVDYLALHVYKNDGKRVYYPRNPLVRGTYSNNPHALLRLDLKPGIHKLYERRRDIDYSLFAYCMSRIELAGAPNVYKEVLVTGEWTAETAGGNPRHPNFYDNPQYRLTLPEEAGVTVRVEAPVKYAVNARILRTDGNRASTPQAKEAATSGTYRPGFCVLDNYRLPAGSYTILPSTFEPGQVGTFRMIVGADTCQPVVTQLAGLGAGMTKRAYKGRWSLSSGTAAGCANHGHYLNNPQFLVRVPSSTKFMMQLKPIGITPFPAINFSLYMTQGGTSLPSSTAVGDAVVTTNKGVYSNPPTGFVTPTVSLPAGVYVAIPSTFAPTEGSFEASFYAESSDFSVSALK